MGNQTNRHYQRNENRKCNQFCWCSFMDVGFAKSNFDRNQQYFTIRTLAQFGSLFSRGVNFEPYREQYQKILPSNDFKYYEIYNASEGFFAIQDLNYSNDLLLMLDYGIFYEFIPMDTFGTSNQKVIPLSEVELFKNYAIVITTNSGLWRYMIGDTVRFTSLSPYRIRVSGRTKHHINVFGEELMVENTDMAIAKTSSILNCEVIDYTVAPIFMKGKEKGAHEWMIEFKKQPEDIAQFQKVLDETLQTLNSDYEAKRYNNMTLNELSINVARENLFYDWLKENDKLGGQHKIPRLSNQRDYLEQLKQMNEVANSKNKIQIPNFMKEKELTEFEKNQFKKELKI